MRVCVSECACECACACDCDCVSVHVCLCTYVTGITGCYGEHLRPSKSIELEMYMY